MSLDNCLNSLGAAGQIDANRAAQARRMYEEAAEAFARTMDPDEAARRASEHVVEKMKRMAQEKRRQTLLQTQKQRQIQTNLLRYRTASRKEDWAAAAVAHLDRDEVASFSNVEARRKAVLGQAHSRMVDVLSTFRRDLIGRVRAPAKLGNLVREAFGETTGDASARELARAWSDTAEYLRGRYNAAGGHIPKRRDWALPQMHDMLAVRKAGFGEWREFVRPLLDPARMYDEITGLPMSPQQLEMTLRGVFDTVSTAGLNSIEPSGLAITGKLGNRRADPRFLAFKDPAAWMAYQEKFGEGTIFDVMMGYTEGMSRDIALMEVLGPNPAATIRWLEQTIKKTAVMADTAALTDKASNRANVAAKQIRDMFAQINGQASTPINGKLARGFAAGRSWLVSSLLGSAALSAVTDVGFQRVAAKHAGLPIVGVLQRYWKLFRPTVKEDQKVAVRLGLIADNWSTIASGQQRYVGEVNSGEISRRLADFTMRASMLSPWTQAGRWAFGMEFMGTLADNAGRKLADMPAALSKALKRYGIDEAGWDIIRKTKLYQHKGAAFLRPDDIAARRDIPAELADKLTTQLLEMVQSETEFAVPAASLRGRVMLLSDVPPGTFVGEVMRSVAFLKNFGVTMVYTHMMRGVAEKGTLGKAAYAANLIITMTVMGALAMQLKAISKGQTPVPMTGDDAPEFWGAAMLQGGGIGIFGDFLLADSNRFDSSLGETLAGPVFGAATDVKRFAVGNAGEAAGQLMTGEPIETNAGREAVNMAKRYTPGGSLWYARLAFQRLVLDQLQKEIDPDHGEAFRRMEDRARKEVGNDFWWRPGEIAPEAAPI